MALRVAATEKVIGTMCGICGVAWKDVTRPAGLAEVRAMNDAQQHRGPDDEGEYDHGPMALGHRRLSIIDLSPLGHQPMLAADAGCAIIHNGEIYNFVEIRRELEQRGVAFVSDTDTEVLLQAYLAWGPDCVSRFNGMWAFAVYDRRKGRIFLSRDRFGIKPLYYVNDDKRFAFASEIKALLAAFGDLRTVNDAFLHHFLPTGMLDDGPETSFATIAQLLPAHSALYDLATGTLRTWRYWDVEPQLFRERWVGRDPVASLRHLLQSSIELHMRSDVPVGTCLSGGIDSSAIVGLMSGMRQDPVHTFSGLYDDKDCDEQRFVEAVRRRSGCHGCDIRREPDGDFVDDLATITWHQDTPTAGPGLYTQFNVMARASRDVTVILDGQGSDELFAGYLPYYAMRIDDLIRRGGFRGRREALGLTAAVARHWAPDIFNAAALSKITARYLPAAHRLLSRIHPGTREPPVLHPGLAQRVAGREMVRHQPEKYGDRLSQTLFRHLVDQSIPALLHYEDRNSMAFSLEARVPLLDHRIVEFALGLGVEYKIRDTWTKWILRKAAEDQLPPQVAWRRSKMGYPTPAARWMRQPKDRDALHELLFSRRFLDREIVSRDSLAFYWNQHQSQRADRSWLLYRYATVELWHRHFIDGFIPKPAAAARRPRSAPRSNAATRPACRASL